MKEMRAPKASLVLACLGFCLAVIAAPPLRADVWTGPGPGSTPVPADYDGDGRAHYSVYQNGAWHFYNDDGTYKKGIWTGGVAGDRPVPADYDGDGKTDVVIFRDGTWLFYDYATGAYVRSVTTGSLPGAVPEPMDYDGDGRAEFTVYHQGVWTFYNDDGSYLKGIWTGGVVGDIPVPGDYNGDGIDEPMIFRGGAWLFYDFSTGANYAGVWTGASGTLQPAPMDYDGDGTTDFTIYANGAWHFYNDDGTYKEGIWTGGVAGDIPAPADFDGNGIKEPVIFRGGAWLFFYLGYSKAGTPGSLNSTFEQPGGWSLCEGASSVSFSRVTSQFHSGQWSAQMDVTQSGSQTGLCSSLISVNPNTGYRLGAWLRAPQDRQAVLRVVEWSNSSVIVADRTLATSSGRSTPRTGPNPPEGSPACSWDSAKPIWEELKGFFITAANTKYVEVRLMHSVPGSPGTGTFNWDDVDLRVGDADPWERWEKSLNSTRNYAASGGNPYRDLTLMVTFFKNTTGTSACPALPSSCTLPNCWKGYGFWDGRPTQSPRLFKIRTALPAGDWCWQTECSGASGGSSCAGDSGLTKTGKIKVLPRSTPSTNKLYTLGLPKVASGSRYLVYGDEVTTFPWLSDTAWAASIDYTFPSAGSLPSSDVWKNYVADRATKGFTAILIAPAPQYIDAPSTQPAPPSTGFQGFRSICRPGDYTIVPNECSYGDNAYWRKLDAMVKDANDAGIILVVAGLIDPLDRGAPPKPNANPPKPRVLYPNQDEAVRFARNLAARLSGSFVIFSPGFDDNLSDTAVGGGTVQASMAAVGLALKANNGVVAAKRHLVGNHLAGGSAFSDYDVFQPLGWLSFQLFQSGHKSNSDLTHCAFSSAYDKAVCRAREMSLRFRCIGTVATDLVQPCTSRTGTAKPGVNSEGAYEGFPIPTGDDPDTRAGVRHTGFYSALSGSFGYTIGIRGIYNWDNPGIFDDCYNSNQSQADNDLARLASFFRSATWTELEPRHNLIASNPTNEKTRMVLAGNSTYALAYVPGATATVNNTITIKTANENNLLSNLDCTTTWSKVWVSPREDGAAQTARCTPGSGVIVLDQQPNCSTSTCDWVLKLTRSPSGTPSALNTLENATANDLQVWTVESSDGSTTAVMAQLLTPDGTPLSDEIVVSPQGEVFHKLPTVARNVQGDFLVVWEAEFLDGSVDGIYAQRFDSTGNLEGERFQVNTFTEHQQGTPSVTADASGNFVVTWMSYGQDGDMGGIFARRFDEKGAPLDDSEFQVNTFSSGHQSFPQVRADGKGNFVMAWTSDGQDGDGEGVFLQRFDGNGQTVGPETQVNTTTLGNQRLVDLQVDSLGNIHVEWESRATDGGFSGQFEQQYDAEGRPTGGETPVGGG